MPSSLWHVIRVALGNSCTWYVMAHLCALHKGKDHVSDSSSEGRRKGREERKEGGREEEKDQNAPRLSLTPVGKTVFAQEGFYFCLQFFYNWNIHTYYACS